MSSHLPGVFVIESNDLEDEECSRQEGQALKEILTLSERPVQYRYIRTRKELISVLGQFRNSRFRYLHLACHGNKTGLSLTLDPLPFADLAELLSPYMNYRRLFISACDSTRRALAEPLFQTSHCYSVIGPRGDITFPDAAISWASFYSLMSKENPQVMRRTIIEKKLQKISRLFGVRYNAFFRHRNKAKLVVFRPS